MGLLIDGKWRNNWYDTKSGGGRFVRSDSQFRNWVTPGGGPGPSGQGGFKAQSGRYHLYVSLACPWAHRTLVFRELKGLEQAVSLSVVDWFMGENGWEFPEREGATPDPAMNARYFHQVYTAARPDRSIRLTGWRKFSRATATWLERG